MYRLKQQKYGEVRDMPKLWFGKQVTDEEYNNMLQLRNKILNDMKKAIEAANQAEQNPYVQNGQEVKQAALTNSLNLIFEQIKQNPNACPEIEPKWLERSKGNARLLNQSYTDFSTKFLNNKIKELEDRNKVGFDAEYNNPANVNQNEAENEQNIVNPFEGMNDDPNADPYKAAEEAYNNMSPIDKAKQKLENIERLNNLSNPAVQDDNQKALDETIINESAELLNIISENPEVRNLFGGDAQEVLSDMLTERDSKEGMADFIQYAKGKLGMPVAQNANPQNDNQDNNAGNNDENLPTDAVEGHEKAIELLTRLNEESARTFDEDDAEAESLSNQQLEKDMEQFIRLAQVNEGVAGHLDENFATKLRSDFKQNPRFTIRNFIQQNGYKYTENLDPAHLEAQNNARRNSQNQPETNNNQISQRTKDAVSRLYDKYTDYRMSTSEEDKLLNSLDADDAKDNLFNAIEADPVLSKRLKKGWKEKVTGDYQKHGVVALGAFCETIIEKTGMDIEVRSFERFQSDKELNSNVDNLRKEDNKFLRDEAMMRQYEQLQAAYAMVQSERKKLEEERRKLENAQRAIREGRKQTPEIKNKKGKRMEFAEDVLNDKTSEKRGYKATFMDEEKIVSNQARETRRLKYLVKELHPNLKKSKQFKKAMTALEDFNAFMQQIDGRTRLTPEEMEIYDRLSLRVYRSSKEYVKHKQEQHEKRFENVDINPETGKKYGEDEFDDRNEKALINAVEKVNNDVQIMRQNMFQHNIDEMAEDMNKQCEAEMKKLDEQRKAMQGHGDQDDIGLEDNIATTIYFTHRMDQLKKAGDLKLKPGETLSMAKERLNKSLIPKQSELTEIKKSAVTKSLVAKCKEDPDRVLTDKDIKDAISGEALKQSQQNKKLQEIQQNIHKPGPANEPRRPDAPGLH